MTKGIIICDLDKRKGRPSLTAEKVGSFVSGDEVEILNVVIGETETDQIQGSRTWYRISDDHYLWSGGVSMDLNEEVFRRKLQLDKSENIEVSQVGNSQENITFDWWYSKYRIEELTNFQNLSGENVTVTIIDSGFNFIDGYFSRSRIDGLNWKGDSLFNDRIGHGTKVSSVLSAKGPGLRGVAPGCNLFICKYYETEPAPNQLLQALLKVPDSSEVIVISTGFLKQDIDQVLFKDLQEAFREISTSKVIICACGDDYNHNDNPFHRYPASFPETVSVASVASDNNISSFSTKSTKINVSAPGSSIKVIDGISQSIITDNGTSYSAPFVAGVAAILKSNFPAIHIKDIYKSIETTLTPKDPDVLYGKGIINPWEAFKILSQ